MTLPAANKIAFWQLKFEDEEKVVAVPDSVEGLIYTSGTVDIGIFEPQKDVRTPVSEVDSKTGGKYHRSFPSASSSPCQTLFWNSTPSKNCKLKSDVLAILKLFIQYGASKTWKTATGWLSKDNIVVTAAHCIYDHGQRATCVQALIGYNAVQENANISTVEQRFVKRIAAPLEWINAESEQCDVAFLQLDSPFHNVKPIAYDTPEISTHQCLTVAGYPADLSVGGMPGGKIYEMKIDKDIHLERTKNNMLRYQGDLQGGEYNRFIKLR
jgi:hypothetical protein